MSDVVKKIVWAAVLTIPSTVVGILLRGVLDAWGILDPLSKWLGSWLKMHVSPGQVGWTIAFVLSVSAYCVSLWLMRTHIRSHQAAVAGGDSIGIPIGTEKGKASVAAAASEKSGDNIFDLIQDINPTLHARCAKSKWKPCHEEMYKQLQCGAFVATGLPRSRVRTVIPAIEWNNLRFLELHPAYAGDYNENRDWHRAQDASGSLIYLDIRISRATTTLSHGPSQ